MRRPKKSSAGSLDSLLDTMTNVVGILVILLTVTQLGVSDAVKRIGTSSTVKPEEIDEAAAQLAELLKLRADLEARLKALVDQDDVDAEQKLRELKKLKKQIEDYKANVEILLENQENKRRQAEFELLKLKEEVESQIRKQEEEADKLREKIHGNEDELATLRARLAETSIQEALPAKEIILPNPRPAPEGIKAVIILCREGRVMLVDVEGIQELAQKRTGFIIKRKRLDRDPAAGIDGKALAEEFNQDPVNDRNRNFDVKMKIAGRVPKLVLHRREEAGETAEQLQRSGSRYQTQVKRIDPDEFYLQFLVWPDSFEAYLEARRISARRGLLAGWHAQTTSEEYTIDLGSKLLVGPPPPPPKPKPKPKPGEEPPKPPPKPAPKPRPVPTDVID
ncbi:MAG TPA: hypothetical protein VMY37_01465 [Thermoguttaceae bacterium]|nr:hypothetical protein [Thermoguttaceae bacterium]